MDWNGVSADLLERVFWRVSTQDVGRVACVSKSWNNVACSSRIWEERLVLEFGKTASKVVSNGAYYSQFLCMLALQDAPHLARVAKFENWVESVVGWNVELWVRAGGYNIKLCFDVHDVKRYPQSIRLDGRVAQNTPTSSVDVVHGGIESVGGPRGLGNPGKLVAFIGESPVTVLTFPMIDYPMSEDEALALTHKMGIQIDGNVDDLRDVELSLFMHLAEVHDVSDTLNHTLPFHVFVEQHAYHWQGCPYKVYLDLYDNDYDVCKSNSIRIEAMLDGDVLARGEERRFSSAEVVKGNVWKSKDMSFGDFVIYDANFNFFLGRSCVELWDESRNGKNVLTMYFMLDDANDALFENRLTFYVSDDEECEIRVKLAS